MKPSRSLKISSENPFILSWDSSLFLILKIQIKEKDWNEKKKASFD